MTQRIRLPSEFKEEEKDAGFAAKEGEGIEIGEAVTVKVIRTGPRSVRLGIEAPGEIPVLRSELFAEWDPRGDPLHAECFGMAESSEHD